MRVPLTGAVLVCAVACVGCGLLTSVDPTGAGGSTTSANGSTSSVSATTGGTTSSTTGAGGGVPIPVCWPNAKPVITCHDLGADGPAHSIALPSKAGANFIVGTRSAANMRAEVFEFDGDVSAWSTSGAVKNGYATGEDMLGTGAVAIDDSVAPVRLLYGASDHLLGLAQRVGAGVPIQLTPQAPAMWAFPRVVKTLAVSRPPSPKAGTLWAVDDDCNVWNETAPRSEQMSPLVRLNASDAGFSAAEFHSVAAVDGRVYISLAGTSAGPALHAVAADGTTVSTHPLPKDAQPQFIQGIAADDSYVYFLDFSSGYIMRIAFADFGTAGKEAQVVKVAGDDATTHDIAVDDHCLYRAGYHPTMPGNYALLACDKETTFSCVVVKDLGPSIDHAFIHGLAADARGLFYTVTETDGKNQVCVVQRGP